MELTKYDLKNKKDLEYFQNMLKEICQVAHIEDIDVKKGERLHFSSISSTYDDNFETTSLTITVEPWDSYNYRYSQKLTLNLNGNIDYCENFEHVYFVNTGYDDCDKEFEYIYNKNQVGKIDDLDKVQKIFNEVLGPDIKSKRIEQKKRYDEIVAENEAIANAYKTSKSAGMHLDYEKSFNYYLKNGLNEKDAAELASKKIIKEEVARFEHPLKKKAEVFAEIKDGDISLYACIKNTGVNEEGATCLKTSFDKLVTLPAKDIGVFVEDGSYKLVNLNATQITPEGIFEKTSVEIGKNTNILKYENLKVEIDECEFHNNKLWAICTIDNIDITSLVNDQNLSAALEDDAFDADNLRLEIITIKDQNPQLFVTYYGHDYEYEMNEYGDWFIINDGDQFPLCVTDKDSELIANSIMNNEEVLDAIREEELDDRDVR